MDLLVLLGSGPTEAFEAGQSVGRILFYVLLAVAVVFLVRKLLKRDD